MAPVRENDTRFAHKALNIVAGLSGTDRQVAGAIIDHFNKQSGRCDPSIERLATLLGVDRASVIRATNKLCAKRKWLHSDDEVLVEKISHGGHRNCAAYLPNWELLNAIVADWDARLRVGAAPGTSPPDSAPAPSKNVAGLRPRTSQNCDLERRKIATQTLRRNPLKEPIQVEQVETQARNQDGQVVPERPSGLLRGSEREAKRTPPKVVHPVAPGIAAEAAASRRWDAELRAMGWDAYGAIVDAITPEIADEATAAEMRRRGTGCRLILERLRMRPASERRIQ